MYKQNKTTSRIGAKQKNLMSFWGGSGSSVGGAAASNGVAAGTGIGNSGNSSNSGQGPQLNANGLPAFGAPNFAQNQNSQQQPQQSSLDTGLNDFAAMLNAPKAASDAAPKSKGPYDDLTDEALSKALSTAKISTMFRPDALANLFDGNTEKAAALSGMFDQAFQTALQMSARTGIKLSELGLQHSFDSFKTNDLPSFLSQHTVKQGVIAANPLLANPAYKPIYDSMVAGLTAQHPNATHEQIVEHVSKHLKTFAEGLSTTKTNPNDAGNSNSNGGAPATTIFDDKFFN